MTFSPTLDEVAAIIADAMALGMNAWMIIMVDPEHLSTTLDFLLQELDLHAQDLDASVSILEASQLTATTLPWGGARSPRAFVIRGLESLPVEQLERLDLDRGRFIDGPTIVAVTTPEGASRLALHAPNLWSWVGSQCFPGIEPQPMDVESRIRSIRDELGITEEELVRRAEAGTIPRSGERTQLPP